MVLIEDKIVFMVLDIRQAPSIRGQLCVLFEPADLTSPQLTSHNGGLLVTAQCSPTEKSSLHHLPPPPPPPAPPQHPLLTAPVYSIGPPSHHTCQLQQLE